MPGSGTSCSIDEAMRRVLIVKAGSYSGPRERLGDYDAWFRNLVAQAGANSFTWVAAEAPPPAEAPAAVIVSGSGASMTAPEPWILTLCAYVRGAVERGVPVLGVCFGHQLLAHAFGGRVEKHPRGREVGTVEVEITDVGASDPLFVGLPRRLRVNTTHRDEVADLPAGALVLARNAWSPVQAFALGSLVRGVQFHPEYTGEVLREYALARRDFLEREAGPGTAGRVAATSTDTPEARSIVANFVRHFSRA
jgi:GMP synthase (glutamine-hydrolysing)